MRLNQLIFAMTMASWMVVTGCGDVRTQNTEDFSASFGLLDEANHLTPTNRIPHRVGVQYAWRLTVDSTNSKVRVKEIFELPAGAPWVGNPSVPDGMKIINTQRSPSGNISMKEFDLDMVSDGDRQETKKNSGFVVGKEVEITQPYLVADGDPQGTHKITIYVNGKLVKDFSFQVAGE